MSVLMMYFEEDSLAERYLGNFDGSVNVEMLSEYAYYRCY